MMVKRVTCGAASAPRPCEPVHRNHNTCSSTWSPLRRQTCHHRHCKGTVRHAAAASATLRLRPSVPINIRAGCRFTLQNSAGPASASTACSRGASGKVTVAQPSALRIDARPSPVNPVSTVHCIACNDSEYSESAEEGRGCTTVPAVRMLGCALEQRHAGLEDTCRSPLQLPACVLRATRDGRPRQCERSGVVVHETNKRSCTTQLSSEGRG
jgi:hypothetical protein